MTNKDNPILNKSFNFALCIIDLHGQLLERKHYAIAQQVIRSGTSIGANVREAQRAESKADFIHKMAIALKEADETDYWFSLIDAKVVPIGADIREQLQELIRLLVSIIKASKENKVTSI